MEYNDLHKQIKLYLLTTGLDKQLQERILNELIDDYDWYFEQKMENLNVSKLPSPLVLLNRGKVAIIKDEKMQEKFFKNNLKWKISCFFLVISFSEVYRKAILGR
jgi:hypothetical protein